MKGEGYKGLIKET